MDRSDYIEGLRQVIEQKKQLRGCWSSPGGDEDNERQIRIHEERLRIALDEIGVE